MRYDARPQSLFTFAFDLVVGDRILGVVQHRLFGRRGVATVGDVEYEIVRTGPVAWALSQTGIPGAVVSAERPGLLRTRYRLTWDGGEVDLVRSGLGYRFALHRDGVEVGGVKLANLFSRRLIVDAPEDMPVSAVAMLVWLVVRMRRAAASAAAAGA